MRDFISPKKNRFIHWFFTFFYDKILKKIDNINEVIINSGDLSMLKTLKDKRVLLFSNHPSNIEPKLMFYVGKLMNTSFNFMASRDIFTWTYGLFGFFIRRVGAYSIILGKNDMVSFRYSIKVLVKENSKLAIFPEGVPLSGENITLMPFQSGFSFLSMLSLDKIRKNDPNGDIFVLPIFFFYIYDALVEEMKTNINERLQWLEKYYNLETSQKKKISIIERILEINALILEKYEKIYGESTSSQDSAYRWEKLRHHILDKLAIVYKVKNYDKKENAIIKFRKIYAIETNQVTNSAEEKIKFSKEENIQNKLNFELLKAILVLNEKHLIENPSYEKIFEWLERFESITKKSKAYPPKLPRKAYIKVGNILKISDYYSTEKSKRNDLMESITNRVEEELRALLLKMEPLSHKL